jgi:glycosyltransferase involved in cell wall biosynthesis
MKKVLYAGGFKLPDGNAAAHRVVSVSKGLQKLGCQVNFIHGKAVINLDTLSSDINIHGEVFPKFSFRKLTGLDVILASLRTKSNYIILYNYWSFPFLMILIFGLVTRKKIIADCTEWYDADCESSIKRVLKWLDSETRMRILHRLCFRIISISKYLHLFYGKRSVLIPPTVDIKDKKWEISKGLAGNLNKFTFLYSGNVGVRKDRLDYLLRILSTQKEGKQCEVFIAGTTKNEFIKSHALEDLPVGYERITRFVGRLSHQELISLQKKCHALFFYRPNTRANKAGFPTKLVEAFTVGLPIITNPMGDVSSFISSPEYGVVLGPDTELNLKKLIEIYRPHRKNLRDRFDYNNYLSELEQVFK